MSLFLSHFWSDSLGSLQAELRVERKVRKKVERKVRKKVGRKVRKKVERKKRA